jgi:hypothetical protein
VGLFTAASDARGEEIRAADAPPWRFHPGARVILDFPVGDARLLIGRALGVGLSLSVGPEGSAHRGRVSLGIQPLTDVGPGASLQLLSAQVGAERWWRRRLVTALELGGVLRHLSLGHELGRTSLGVGATMQAGWRALSGGRWSMTGGIRYAVSWFSTDGFIWQQLGLFVGVDLK